MSALIMVIVVVLSIWLVLAPRKYAVVPFLCMVLNVHYMVVFDVAGIVVPVFRLAVILSIIRILLRGEFRQLKWTQVDSLVFAFACLMLFASCFHQFASGTGPVFTMGTMLNTVGSYFVVRVLAATEDSRNALFKAICYLMIPVAFCMLMELVTSKNVFVEISDVFHAPIIRNGRLRAQGPFSHPILAGSIGAVCFPLVLINYRTAKVSSILGACACILVVLASASSGPILSIATGVGVLCAWRYRAWLRHLPLYLVALYVLLSLVMSQPPYYLASRIDLTGGSTGFHRAFLIQQTLAHLNEWWLVGTEATRHWMPSQGAISDTQTDITNYYIAVGCDGGLFSLGTLLCALFLGYMKVARSDLISSPHLTHQSFCLWCVFSAFVSLLVTGLSISYFGQSQVVFWMVFALLVLLVDESSGVSTEVGRESEA